MTSKKFKYQRRRDSSTAEHCCVPFCGASSKFNSVLSFHTFPVHKERRGKWLHNIRREQLNVTSHTRVCSRHFIADDVIEPSRTKGRRLLRKKAVPKLFQWNNYTFTEPKNNTDEEKRNEITEVPVILPMNEQNIEHDYCSHSEHTTSVINEHDRIKDLRKEVERLKKQLEELSINQTFGLRRFAASDDDIKFYTRFVTYSHLMAFWKLIEPSSRNMVHVSKSRSTTMKRRETGSIESTLGETLQPIDEFFLFMIHLSVGLTHRDLAHRFNINQSTVIQIITTWTNFLYMVLGSVRIWMSEEAVKALLPNEFQDYRDTHVLIDCIQLRCQTTSSLQNQNDDFFSYKSHCVFKGLVGMAPHGAVTFVSSLYADSVSDQKLFKQSGILSLLKPGMALMIDKDFLIDDDCVQGKVYRLSYMSKREQISSDKMKETRLRDHVDHLILRVKQHKLFDSVIPHSITGIINQLHTVACLLVNYQNGPLVKAPAKN